MDKDTEWVIARLQNMSSSEIYQWIGDEVNLESKGMGAAPLKREDAESIGAEKVQAQLDDLDRHQFFEHIKSLQGRMAAATLLSSVGVAINELSACGITIPHTESASFLILVSSVYLAVLNIESIAKGTNK